jgi:hypothetical protein
MDGHTTYVPPPQSASALNPATCPASPVDSLRLSKPSPMDAPRPAADLSPGAGPPEVRPFAAARAGSAASWAGRDTRPGSPDTPWKSVSAGSTRAATPTGYGAGARPAGAPAALDRNPHAAWSPSGTPLRAGSPTGTSPGRRHLADA